MNRIEFHHEYEARSKQHRAVTVSGRGLHTGAESCVEIARGAEITAPVTLGGPKKSGAAARFPLSACCVAESARSTRLVGGGLAGTSAVDASTVEHLLAAFAGLGVHRGVDITLFGPEVPLACGSARSWVDALGAIGFPAKRERDDVRDPDRETELIVARDAFIALGDGWYRFTRGAGVHVGVTCAWPYAYLEPRASWNGSRSDFAARIAPARTIALAEEALALVSRGLAQFVDPVSVVLVSPDGLVTQGAPAEADEPARHKLLDVLGDLYVHGGPPRGRVEAHRPSHARTHEAIRQALTCGALVRRGAS